MKHKNFTLGGLSWGFLSGGFCRGYMSGRFVRGGLSWNHLHMYLERSPADTISGLELNSANYHEAIKLLTNRFSDKQIIVGSYMDSLLKLPAVETMDLKKLISLYDHIEGSVRRLASV